MAVAPSEHFPFPADVFHELEGSSTASHRRRWMPETPRTSSRSRVSRWCRPWPASVEQGDDFVVREGAGLPPPGGRNCSSGRRWVSAPSRCRRDHGLVHPGAAALGAGVEVHANWPTSPPRPGFRCGRSARPHPRSVRCRFSPDREQVMTLNRPATTFGSGKYCFTSWAGEGALLAVFPRPRRQVPAFQSVMPSSAQRTDSSAMSVSAKGFLRHIAQGKASTRSGCRPSWHQRDFGNNWRKPASAASSARSSRGA